MIADIGDGWGMIYRGRGEMSIKLLILHRFWLLVDKRPSDLQRASTPGKRFGFEIYRSHFRVQRETQMDSRISISRLHVLRADIVWKEVTVKKYESLGEELNRVKETTRRGVWTNGIIKHLRRGSRS